MTELARITAVNAARWRARFALRRDDDFGPHISSRVLEVTERDAGRIAVPGQPVASPVAAAVFAEAEADPAAALALLWDKARYDGYAPDPDEPVGAKEIAAMLDVEEQTVRQWGVRERLPEPTWPSVGGRPAWRRGTIIQWARETGRMPAPDAAPVGLAAGHRASPRC
jgi:hypothetical protein